MYLQFLRLLKNSPSFVDSGPDLMNSRRWLMFLAVPGSAMLLVLILLGTAPAQAQEPDKDSVHAAQEIDFVAEVQPIIEEYCADCHGEDVQKADFRIDRLDPDMVAGPDAENWHVVLDMIQSGEMPPRRAFKPTDEERRLFVKWIRDSLHKASIAKEGERKVVLRRLNRSQYSHTLQELLGLPVDFGRVLPSDGKSEMGFTNNGEVLQSSPLHLDYYQSIARDALNKAIAVGEKPEVSRYRVTFGKGIGKSLPAGKTGGYQSVPLNPDDFVVDILAADGTPKVGGNPEEQAQIDAVKKKISIGLRGSSQDRFRVVEEGMILFAAVPHKEKVPKAWQGPSPNLKLQLQRCFPEVGDFAFRVRASHGYLPTKQEEVLVSLDEQEPLAVWESREKDQSAPSDIAHLNTVEKAVVVEAVAGKELNNLELREDVLAPVELTADSSAQLELKIPKNGFYWIDLVHPVATLDAMPSVHFELDEFTLDWRFEPTEEDLAKQRIVTNLGAAYLKKGKHKLKIGGAFFIGFSHLVFSPLADDHPVSVRLTPKPDKSALASEVGLPAMRAFVGTRLDDGMDYDVFDRFKVVEAPFGQSAEYTFYGRLENLPIPEPESGDKEILSGILLVGLWNDHLVKSNKDSGPPLLIESLEFEAPYYPSWPPDSHKNIFFDSPLREDEEEYTRAVLADFGEQAFRRPLRENELQRYMDFWREIRAEYQHEEHAVREVLVAMLCSPNFLFMTEPKETEKDEDQRLSELALATRLSYFLWNSPPDAELREAAKRGVLRKNLGQQVERLMDDQRMWRFLRGFSYEWLRLDRFRSMTVNVDAYPRFTRFVKADMEEETYQFLYEVFRKDLSLLTLIDSDFAMLNQNLAEFYGVPDVRGNYFRPVKLTPEERRGGLLSQGSFLTGHSDGTEAHTIKRAVWLKEKILGEVPPPPPPNVPELDPDAPGFENLTLKQQLEKHRDSAACMDCHASIDPYGVVFEQYDAVGQYQVKRKDQLIDANSILPDGTEVDGIAGIKSYLLEKQQDKVAAALVEHLFAYALGRDIHFSDEAELNAILDQVRLEDYRIRAVIHEIVASPSFQKP